MRRFFVPPSDLAGTTVTVTGDTFRHMARVLRLKVGTRVLLADGEGLERMGVIDKIHKDSILVILQESTASPVTGEGPRITLFQGLPKGEKMDLIVQKSTELGVSEIVSFIADRTVARLTTEREPVRVDRWQRIAREAARQSGRASVPRVAIAKSLEEALVSCHQSVRLLLWEEERETRLKEALARFSAPESIALIIGPEGGISPEEASAAFAGGFIPVSLGRRIVRTETASIVMLAIVQFYWGDMG